MPLTGSVEPTPSDLPVEFLDDEWDPEPLEDLTEDLDGWDFDSDGPFE